MSIHLIKREQARAARAKISPWCPSTAIQEVELPMFIAQYLNLRSVIVLKSDKALQGRINVTLRDPIPRQ